MGTEKPTLLYIADAMCSWCWGFAPVLDEVREKYKEELGFQLVMGGLRPGPAAAPLDDAMKEFLRHHWEEVAEATGQPFDNDFFDREGFIYDTEPAARAVVTLRHMAPDYEYEFYHAVQEGFYARNVDITETGALTELLPKSVEQDLFRERFDSDDMRQATLADFTYARDMGVNGFPALLLGGMGEKGFAITVGYAPRAAIIARIEEVLKATL